MGTAPRKKIKVERRKTEVEFECRNSTNVGDILKKNVKQVHNLLERNALASGKLCKYCTVGVLGVGGDRGFSYFEIKLLYKTYSFLCNVYSFFCVVPFYLKKSFSIHVIFTLCV